MGQNTDSAKKILIIDDEKGIRDLLSYALSAKGYCIATAGDGEEGLAAIRQEKFHLVISDIKMPKRSGLELLDDIRQIDPGLEVIIITGFGTIDLAVEAIKKGAYHFVQKPLNVDEIVPLVDKALEKAELRSLVKLYENCKAIFSAIRLEDLLPVLTDLSRTILKADDISIMLLDEHSSLAIAASHGLENDADKALRLSLGNTAVRKTTAVNDDVTMTGPVEKDDNGEKRQVHSALLCPLMMNTKVLGVLCAARTRPGVPFEASDRNHARIFASQIAQAIHNAQVYHELERKLTDVNEAYAKLSGTKSGTVQAAGLVDSGRLITDVAHRLRNALSVIMGLSEFLLENENQSEDTRRDLRLIMEQAAQSCMLITKISRAVKTPR